MNTVRFESAANNARADFAHGLGLNANPYAKGSAAYDAYMMEMAKLQYEEFHNEQIELRAGV